MLCGFFRTVKSLESRRCISACCGDRWTIDVRHTEHHAGQKVSEDIDGHSDSTTERCDEIGRDGCGQRSLTNWEGETPRDGMRQAAPSL